MSEEPATPPAPTTTTITTATTVVSEAPVVAQIHWYESQRFIALLQSTVLWVLSWLIAALSTNEWAWRAMAIGVLTNMLVAFRDWWNPRIIAPKMIAALGANKSNPEIKAFTGTGGT